MISLHPVQGDTMTATNSISNSIADTPEFNVNETSHIQAVILTPSISILS